MLPEEVLRQHYETNFNLLYYHKIDIRIFDDMIPWQKDVYLAMMVKTVEDENLKKQLAESAARAAGKKPNRTKRRRQ